MRDELIDPTATVRAGEELDLARLGPYLRDRLGRPAGEPIEVEQFPGGHSNLTYLVRVGGDEYVLRRPPFGSKVATAHDMGREVRVLSALAPHYPRAPRPVAYCEDASVIGCPFYVMRRVRGVILRRTPPAGMTLDRDAAAALCRTFVDTFAELHAIDPAAVGLADFGKPDGYVRRQVEGWTKRYRASQTDDVPVVEQVARWLAEHMPPSGRGTIIHNDFKFDNVVLDPAVPTRIVGILDWEMSTLGDPLMDLGTTLSYWIQPGDPPALQAVAFGPTMLPGMFSRRQLADAYAARTGRDVSNVVFYYCYGLFKTGVVVQQIHYRYRQGLTHDERFASLGTVMKLLMDEAAAAAARGTLSA